MKREREKYEENATTTFHLGLDDILTTSTTTTTTTSSTIRKQQGMVMERSRISKTG
jgi:hypothetical protein